MWHLVKGLCEIHDDHVCLSVTPVLSSVQVTNHVMKELNQFGFCKTFDYGSRAGCTAEVYSKIDLTSFSRISLPFLSWDPVPMVLRNTNV